MSVKNSGPLEWETATGDLKAPRQERADHAKKSAVEKSVRRSGLAGGRLPRLWTTCMSGTVLAGFSAQGMAQAEAVVVPAERLFTSADMTGYALVVGVLSAILLSAGWLIRQRGRLEAEGNEMRAALSDANQRISRYQALIADKNRRIVIWDGQSSKPEFLGQLPAETGAPQTDGEFLAFGR